MMPRLSERLSKKKKNNCLSINHCNSTKSNSKEIASNEIDSNESNLSKSDTNSNSNIKKRKM